VACDRRDLVNSCPSSSAELVQPREGPSQASYLEEEIRSHRGRPYHFAQYHEHLQSEEERGGARTILQRGTDE
jgi:hypothetical protein